MLAQSRSSAGDQDATPVSPQARITNLDAVRGIAVLGILTMNVVSFGLVATAPYFNLSAGGAESWLDWLIGGAGEILADQKFMGLFSMLFGAGIVLFADRAAAKGRHAVLFSLWRNFLLLLIGIAHTLFWDGDILVIYALCAPILIALRRLRPIALMALGVGVVMLSPLLAIAAADTVGANGAGLGEYWFTDAEISDEVGLFLYADFFCRALGMMLIGVALYRTGVITGARSTRFYRRLAAWGLGIGIPLAALGFALVAGSGYRGRPRQLRRDPRRGARAGRCPREGRRGAELSERLPGRAPSRDASRERPRGHEPGRHGAAGISGGRQPRTRPTAAMEHLR